MLSPTKLLATITGLLMLAASTHLAVSTYTKYGSPQSIWYIALALGIAAGAVCVGHAFSERRILLAAGIIVALFAGEAFTLLTTAERVVADREARQAPIIARTKKRHMLVEQLAAITAPETTQRLNVAQKSLETINAREAEKTALRGCRKLCVASFREQRVVTLAEIAAARKELETLRHAATSRKAALQHEINALPVATSASPLADRLGVATFWLDLLQAALASISLNGLACMLISLGAHTKTQRSPAAIASIHQWATASIADKRGSLISLNDAFEDYRRWAISNHAAPASHAEFDLTFGAFIKLAGCHVRKDGDNWLIAGKAISS